MRLLLPCALLIGLALTPAAASPASATSATSATSGDASSPKSAIEGATGLEALWHDACLWEVGSNTEKVPTARKALIAEGERALDFLIPSKLDTKDTLVTRALQAVIGGIGRIAVARLVPCLASTSPDTRRNAADLLGALGATEAAPGIAKLLSDPDARLGALSALATLKAQAASGEIAALMESTAPERVRYTAASTLGAIGGEQAVGALVRQLGSSAAPLRFAAQYALEQIKAVGALRRCLGAADLKTRLHAIAALGHIGDAAARSDLRPFLADPSPVARGFAAEALAAMLEEPDRALLRARLASETDPFARGKIEAALTRSP